MIQFCEIINFGNTIRYVTRQAGSSEFDEPVEFEVSGEINSFEELINAIKKHIEDANIL